jgi:enamine deaminase RidA (YjgF/YER057c/UK114 family)
MQEECEARLTALGLTLPPAPKAIGNYVPYRLSGGQLFISGQLPRTGDGSVITGKLGVTLSVDEGRKAAESACLNLLAQAKAALGSLDRIAMVLRLNGYVNATPDFADHPQVLNGASDLMVTVLQERGIHTRIAVGVSSLPADAAVEIDGIFAVR